MKGLSVRENIVAVPFYFDVDRLLMGGGRVMISLPIFSVCRPAGCETSQARTED